MTLTLLAVLQLVALLRLPGTDMSKLDSLSGASGFNVIALGITPFWSGFVIVELLSFVLPICRKLRREGIAGRSKLNTFAIRVGLGVAALQAAGMAIALQSAVAPGGGNLVPIPDYRFSCPP